MGYHYITDEEINYVNKNVNIEDVLEMYHAEKGRGGKYHCPLGTHEDKKPSMSVQKEKNFCHCFSCGGGGNPISFVQKMENCSFIEAVNKLENEFGITQFRQDDTKEFSIQNAFPFTKEELAFLGFQEYGKIYEHSDESLRFWENDMQTLGDLYEDLHPDFVKGRSKEELLHDENIRSEQFYLHKDGKSSTFSMREEFKEDPVCIMGMISERVQNMYEELCKLPISGKNELKKEKCEKIQEKIEKLVHNSKYEAWINRLAKERDDYVIDER